LGDAYISLEQWDKAEEAFKKVKDEKNHYLFDARLYAGIARYKQGKTAAAARIFNTVETGSMDCWLHGDLVIEIYREFIEQGEAGSQELSAAAYNFFGALLLRYKDDEERALGCFQKAACRVKNTEPGHRLFATKKIIQIAEKTGKKKEVADAWKIRKEVKSHIAANFIVSGDDYFAQGDFWEALNAYERAVNEGGPNGYASYRAAIAHRRMGGEDFYYLVNDYQQALESGLFGVELDEECGHRNETDVRHELEKLLEQYEVIEKVRTLAAAARSDARAAAASLAVLEERIENEKHPQTRENYAAKAVAVSEAVRSAADAAEAAGLCVEKIEHAATSAALGNSIAAAGIAARFKEAVGWAEAAKKDAARAEELAP
jgi:hypothetical protein